MIIVIMKMWWSAGGDHGIYDDSPWHGNDYDTAGVPYRWGKRERHGV